MPKILFGMIILSFLMCFLYFYNQGKVSHTVLNLDTILIFQLRVCNIQPSPFICASGSGECDGGSSDEMLSRTRFQILVNKSF